MHFPCVQFFRHLWITYSVSGHMLVLTRTTKMNMVQPHLKGNWVQVAWLVGRFPQTGSTCPGF